jgi:hypothetical protein
MGQVPGVSSASGSTVGRLERQGTSRVDLGISTQERSHLRLTESAMAPWRADAPDPAGRRPARHGLRIDPEQVGNLSGCEEAVTVFHVVPFLGTRWVSNTRRGRVNGTVNCLGSVLYFVDPMRCVHADVPPRLPLTRDSWPADKKVGVVVTVPIRRVTKPGAVRHSASFPSSIRHSMQSAVPVDGR